jgi:hypothetical protein
VLLTPYLVGPKRRQYRYFTVGGHRVSVARLVLETFVGPRPYGMFALHANDVATEDNLINLRWGTRRENWAEAIRNGQCVQLLRTECPAGHQYDMERKCADGRTWRGCSKCRGDSKFRSRVKSKSRRRSPVAA